jgi:hypothetical protein
LMGRRAISRSHRNVCRSAWAPPPTSAAVNDWRCCSPPAAFARLRRD